jgi:hypothetical protein
VSRNHGADQDEDQREGGEQREGRRKPVVDVNALGMSAANGAGRSRGLFGRAAAAEEPSACLVL